MRKTEETFLPGFMIPLQIIVDTFIPDLSIFIISLSFPLIKKAGMLRPTAEVSKTLIFFSRGGREEEWNEGCLLMSLSQHCHSAACLQGPGGEHQSDAAC